MKISSESTLLVFDLFYLYNVTLKIKIFIVIAEKEGYGGMVIPFLGRSTGDLSVENGGCGS